MEDCVKVVRSSQFVLWFLPLALLAGCFLIILNTAFLSGTSLRAVAILFLLLLWTTCWTGATVFLLSYINSHPKIVLSPTGFYVRGYTKAEIPWQFLRSTCFHSNWFARHGKDVFIEFDLAPTAEELLCQGMFSRLCTGLAQVIFAARGFVVNSGPLTLHSHDIQRAINRYCDRDVGVGSASGLVERRRIRESTGR
jgi:hypothetical protein